VWFIHTGLAWVPVVLADVWKTTPFVALLLLAGLQNIDASLYEAARIDGASAWRQFRYVTLPLLKPAILVALIFRTLDALRIFDLPYVLTKGANGTTTLSLIAQQTFAENRIYGLGAAYSVLTFITVMIVAFIYIRTVGGNIRGLAED
jgi:multiple sugar transport system permease protein